ncbi:MAG: 1-acyl-sn-glycerol-3-phosphate acyltransferase [Chlamydiia bacterium]
MTSTAAEEHRLRVRSQLDCLVSDYLSIGQRHGFEAEDLHQRLEQLWTLVQQQLHQPYVFEPWHTAQRSPFDYLTFGLEFFRPLADPARSVLRGPWDRVREQLDRGENVILLSNHQSEAEPPAMQLLLENRDPKLAEEMVMMAGARVTSDPITIPFSLGRSLLCVYSKRHLPEDPLQRARQLEHNQRALGILKAKMHQGGLCLWVACAGGRDRADETGRVQVIPFDSDSVELLRLLSMQSRRPTHCYPLALDTYRLMPPPPKVEKELGEARRTLGGGVGMSLLNEIDWNALPAGREGREERARLIHSQVAHEVDSLETEIGRE